MFKRKEKLKTAKAKQADELEVFNGMKEPDQKPETSEIEDSEELEKAENDVTSDDSDSQESSDENGEIDEKAINEEASEQPTDVDESDGEEEAEAGPDPVEQAYCLGAGIDEETLNNAKAMLNKIADAVNAGVFNPEVLQVAIKILKYDETLEKTRKEAFESGKAEKIADAFRNKRAKAEEAAAIPHLGGSKEGRTFRNGSIFDLAKDAK